MNAILACFAYFAIAGLALASFAFNPATAKPSLAESVYLTSIDVAITQAKIKISKVYFSQDCLRVPRCEGGYSFPWLTIDSPYEAVDVWSLIEQNLRKQVIELRDNSSQSTSIYEDVYRLAWIQYQLFQPFINNQFGYDKTTDASQVLPLSKFIMTLSKSLFIRSSSDKDVFLVRDQIQQILNDDLARELAAAPLGSGPYSTTLTGTLLAAIRKAVCPLWPLCLQ